MAELGKLAWPYPVRHCANVACVKPFESVEDEAYLYNSLASGKLVVFCDDCARHVELLDPPQFASVPL